MKRYYYLLFIPLTLTFNACGGEEKEAGGEKTEANKTETDFSGMEEIKLNDKDLNAAIKVPQIASSTGDIIPVTVDHGMGDFIWTVKVGDGEKFKLMIENAEGLGDDLIGEKKKMFESFWKIEYLVDESNLIMYKKSIEGEETVPDQYHVFAVVKIDGIPYKVYSDETVQFKKPDAEEMLRSVRSLLEANAEPA
jgi:hypothetical protein